MKITWIGQGEPGDWHDCRNWDHGLPPMRGDLVVMPELLVIPADAPVDLVVKRTPCGMGSGEKLEKSAEIV